MIPFEPHSLPPDCIAVYGNSSKPTVLTEVDLLSLLDEFEIVELRFEWISASK